MSEMNLTRRRTLQGVGAAGLAGIAGNAFVSVGSAQETPQQDGAALRVAHASPDTPTVEVRVNEAGGAGTGTPNVGGDGTPEDDGVGGGGDGEGTPGASGEEPLVEDLGFREVSDYQEVEPGTYRVQIVATEETGLLEEIFGDDGEERVVFDDEVEVEEGTTYTAVAYGELAEADLGGAGTAGETPAGGQTPGGETPEAGQTPGGETPTVGDGGTTPAAGETPTAGGETPGGEGATRDGEVLVEGLAFGEAEYFEIDAGDHTIDAGDHTLEFRESQAAGGDGLGGATTTGGDGTTPGSDVGDDGTTPGDDVGADGGTTPTETPGMAETPTPGATGAGGESDTGFQVAVLEDELTVSGSGTAGDGAGAGGTPEDDGGVGGGDDETPGGAGATPEGEETSRIRVFHAVPDVDAMDVVSLEGEDDGGLFGGDDGTETPADGTPGGEDTPEDDTGVGDGTATPEGDGGLGGEEDGEDGAEQANLSPEGGVVYSGFALGYFDPEAAGGDEAGGAGTPTEEDDGGILDGDEETPAGETPAGEETPQEGTPDEDGITEDPQGEEFEFVTVEDARDGERADGGTGGLFS